MIPPFLLLFIVDICTREFESNFLIIQILQLLFQLNLASVEYTLYTRMEGILSYLICKRIIETCLVLIIILILDGSQCPVRTPIAHLISYLIIEKVFNYNIRNLKDDVKYHVHIFLI